MRVRGCKNSGLVRLPSTWLELRFQTSKQLPTLPEPQCSEETCRRHFVFRRFSGVVNGSCLKADFPEALCRLRESIDLKRMPELFEVGERVWRDHTPAGELLRYLLGLYVSL